MDLTVKSRTPTVFAFLICALATAGSQTAAETVCAEDICIETVDQSDGVDFFVSNRTKALPVTVSIEITSSNLDVVAGSTQAIVIHGGERHPYFSLRAKNDGPWRWQYSFGWARGDFTAVHEDQHLYRLPFEDGEAFRINQSCNGRFSHTGLDRYAVDFGTPEGTVITAARAGRVVDVIQNNSRGGPTRAFREFDNRIVIQHKDRTHAVYSHLQRDGAFVNVGDSVVAGQKIALSGNTGWSTAPHLHFAVAKGQADEYGEITLPVTFASAAGPVQCPPVGALPRLP